MMTMSLAIQFASIICIIHAQNDGSGVFGHWSRESLFRLPFYTYTLDQTTNRYATQYNDDQIQNTVSPSTNATNHLFQFGNDKYVIITSNYGFTQMRTDETGPKFLNDYNRNNYQYGGSNGYLNINNNNILSTWYNGENTEKYIISRNYGIYYRNYYILNKLNNISLNHTVISPFGNDSISISQIKIYNKNNVNMNNIKYIEVFSNAMYQMTDGLTEDKRRIYQINNYHVSYNSIGNSNGIRSNTSYKFPFNETVNDTKWIWDHTPPTTFLSTFKTYDINISIKTGCQLDTFYGKYGAETPTFDVECNYNDDNNNVKYSGLILQLSNINIPKNTEITFYLIYGYVYNEEDIPNYINKYNDINILNNLMYNTAEKWYQESIIFNTNNTEYEWISRELLWDYGYLRSSLTYYNLYNEYILDQGTGYRYYDGFQGAFRDPLQHVLPLIYTNPEYVKSIIRYSLKEIIHPFNDTQRYYNVPYGLEGNGIILEPTIMLAPSDFELYLLYVVSEYILSTKDTDFLNEKVDLDIFGENERYSVLDCLLESYNFLRLHIDVGSHGIIRLQTGDWNDGIVLGKGDIEVIEKYGESGLNTALSLYSLPKFQQVLNMINYSLPDITEFILNQTNTLKNVLWNGQYINRGWIPSNSDGTKGYWLGSLTDGQFYLFPQVWTLLCGENCLSQQNISILLNNIDKRLRFNATTGAIQLWNSSDSVNNGILGNGGSWYAINHPLIMGISLYNASMAFDEWVRNSFYNKASLYPQFWPNVWSSSDSWASYLISSTSPNAVGTSDLPNYPVFCLHSHSWPLFSFINALIGIKFNDKNTLIIKPSLDYNFGSFEFKTKLITLIRDNNNHYFGNYTPKQFIENVFIVTLDLSDLVDDNKKLNTYTQSIQIIPNEHKHIYFKFDHNEQKLFLQTTPFGK